jgi:hypothetical protein
VSEGAVGWLKTLAAEHHRHTAGPSGDTPVISSQVVHPLYAISPAERAETARDLVVHGTETVRSYITKEHINSTSDWSRARTIPGSKSLRSSRSLASSSFILIICLRSLLHILTI